MVKIVGSFEVNDWAHWKSGFDNHAEARDKAPVVRPRAPVIPLASTDLSLVVPPVAKEDRVKSPLPSRVMVVNAAALSSKLLLSDPPEDVAVIVSMPAILISVSLPPVT